MNATPAFDTSVSTKSGNTLHVSAAGSRGCATFGETGLPRPCSASYHLLGRGYSGSTAMDDDGWIGADQDIDRFLPRNLDLDLRAYALRA